jgi:hypothetical protein
VYEMAIPFAEIGAAPGGKVALAFAVYGTANIQIAFAGDPDGVDPDAGPSGTTFTFIVNCRDMDHTAAPVRSDVWIDLNGDGLETSGGILVFPGGAPPWWLLGLAGGGVLAATILLVLRRRLAGVALALVAAAALWGCAPRLTTQEVFPLDTVSPDWTNSAGCVFTAPVGLDLAPGVYPFQYKFVDSSGAPAGIDHVGTQTLTIN